MQNLFNKMTINKNSDPGRSFAFWSTGLFLVLFLFSCQDRDPNPPEGMVFIKGGWGTFGSNSGLPNERPEFRGKVKSFYMDISPVTVSEFRRFIESTGYITYAEKFGNSAVFNFKTGTWELLDGASWEFPLGPEEKKAFNDHPVTQVNWFDACEYAKWSGKRLPTEREWEFAARLGIPKEWRYTWGEQLEDRDGFHANVWQGSFPEKNQGIDGYLLTSPAGAFGKNSQGLTDMGGNVWEWCFDTYRPYKNSPVDFPLIEENKILRGGSFMCDSGYCHGYRVSHRNFTTSETSLFHTGFRCVKDL